MSGVDRLTGVRRKIDRAKKHIVDMQAEVTAFKKTNPYPVGAKKDPQTGELVYYVVRAENVPLAVSITLGDAIQNLRTALDHLAFQLFLAAGGPIQRSRNIAFPTVNPKENKTRFDRCVEGIGDEAIEAIARLEAYQGGKGDQLWVLSELNNTDKHRLLLTVGCSYRRKNLSVFWAPNAQNFAILDGNISHDLTGMPFHSLLDESFDLSNPIFPLKAGDELHRNPAGFEPNKYATFPFEIVLDEPQVPSGEPIMPLVLRVTSLVETTINDLSSYL